jgi:hypothetical protein
MISMVRSRQEYSQIALNVLKRSPQTKELNLHAYAVAQRRSRQQRALRGAAKGEMQ